MIYKILLTCATIIMSSTIGNAMPIGPSAPQLGTYFGKNQIQLIAGQKYTRSKRRGNRRNNNKLATSGGGVKDTCPGGNKGCIKDLKANCDKAGGGLSTEPDGGVDCFVVGIHDQ